MRQTLPRLTAFYFAAMALIASLLASLIGFISGPTEMSAAGLYVAALLVPSSLVWGYVFGRRLRLREHVPPAWKFALAGAFATVLAGSTGALFYLPVAALAIVFSPEAIMWLMALLGHWMTGILAGLAASPLGAITGLILRRRVASHESATT